MAAPNRILSLDLGTQTVAIAEFQSGANGGLILTNYKTAELLADPAVDSTRLAQAKISIGETIATLGYKGQKVNYAVSAQSVFTRFVKLPSVGVEQVDQIVTFEAQQNVPYPIDEVVWDYQLVEAEESKEVEVVLVAIKSDLLEEINESVESAGLRTQVVDVSPMALYNAYRYNYSDVDGCSLLIDIGARTTNLLFIEPKKVFSRSIPIGGTKITEAIAKDFGESFVAAEERKKRDGFVSLGGSYAEHDDPDVARVSKTIRTTMTRLHAEISRSISFYRSQQHGAPPQRVFLCGGSATLPYMREFFHEKFNLPVEFFNPLRNVAVGSNLNVEEVAKHAHQMGELVGLALRSALRCPMELNLRPASVVKNHRIAEQRPYFIMSGVCVALMLLAGWLYFNRAAAATNDVIADLEPKVNRLKGFESQINQVRSQMKAQEALAEPLLKAVRDRQYWAMIIADIQSRLPADFIWITQFTVEESKPETKPASGNRGQGAAAAPKTEVILNLSGLYLKNDREGQVVIDFLDKLKESPHYTIKGDFQRTLPDTSFLAWNWGVQLVLNEPIDLNPQ